MDKGEISPELQVLLDKQSIYDVIMRYCRAIDRCDEELLRTVYHADARDEHGSFNGKASDFVPWVMTGLRERFISTTHSVSNVLIDVEGDVAYSESYVTSYHRLMRDGLEHNWVFAGRYVDRFERRAGAWKIAHRRTVFDWEALDQPTGAKLLPPDAYTDTGQRSRADAVYRR